MKIDLHSHTTQSDGRNSPTELVMIAKAAEVAILAVTDHDSTEGVAEAAEAGLREGVDVVAGIEVSARLEDRDVHVLGIGVDPGSASFQKRLDELRKSRRDRVAKICAALDGMGVRLAVEKVLAEAGGKSVGRKHVARAMVKAGLVKDDQEAFDKYLATGRPANVPPHELTPLDAVRLIRGAGGIPVLAHPGFFDDDAFVERLLDSTPFRGIEVHHRYDSPSKHLRYAAMARRRDLVMTGGSDYHGDDHPHNAGVGQYLTPASEWQRIEALLGR